MKTTDVYTRDSPPLAVADIIKSSHAVMPNDGMLVYDRVRAALSKDKKVQISFRGIDDISTAFLKNFIGNIYLSFPRGFLRDHFFVLDVTRFGFLDKEIERIINETENPEDSDDSFRDVTGIDSQE